MGVLFADCLSGLGFRRARAVPALPMVCGLETAPQRCLAQLPLNSATCHPEAAEASAKRRTPNEGPMHLASVTAAVGECKGPSARKQRGPQDDKMMVRKEFATTNTCHPEAAEASAKRR